jgi:hypothetical protein
VSSGNRSSTWILVGIAVVIAAAVLAVVFTTRYRSRALAIRGAVIRQNSDTLKQSPITDVVVSAGDMAPIEVKSDFSGYFKLTLRRGIKRGTIVALHFRQPDYAPVNLKEPVGDQLLVVRMNPVHPESDAPTNKPAIPVSNVFVRYVIETGTSMNIGTGTKTFQVINKGDVPCNGNPPCSPDGKWKAAVGSVSLDAGEGNVYRNARLSCIAGPCPFTRIQTDNFSAGGRKISVSVLDWSDTTTFLLQAEVFRYQVSDITRESYPVIFGDSLNFTLPAAAEGPSLEAELAGVGIVFPLGPSPLLSWADCNVRVGKDQSKMYRCQLKPGYQFR